MSEEFAGTIDDQSHYEISLTAGQAFLAFVLLLLSLAASFAFGLMIGKGQADERLVVRKEPAIIQEGNVAAGKRSPGRIVDLGVSNDDFKAPATRGATKESVVHASAPPTPVIAEESAPATDQKATVAAAVTSHPVPAQLSVAPASTPAAAPLVSRQVRQPEAPKASSAPAKASPVYAQLLSTGDQKTAEALAAKLIDHGFTGAYVERLPGDRGTMYRVRIRYSSEADARAAEPKLREVVRDVWIAK